MVRFKWSRLSTPFGIGFLGLGAKKSREHASGSSMHSSDVFGRANITTQYISWGKAYITPDSCFNLIRVRQI
jgi:hypothetical protein